jgi:hypothetical protein
MMIVWPDQWYHTSGDRVDKADPTQLKRVAIIGAAAAYTVASADDEMAIRLAGEIASNATRRLGHQFIMGQERLNEAEAGNLLQQYEWARAHVEGTVMAERETLESVMELASDVDRVRAYVEEMQGTVDAIGQAHLAALKTHMETTARRLGTTPVRLQATAMERRAEGIIPRQTALVKAGGYTGWREPLGAVPEEVLNRYPYDGLASTSEVQLLIDGRHSVMDIKKMLDAQMRTTSDLQSILNYLEILRAAGLVEM